jgi:TPR repeat protein
MGLLEKVEELKARVASHTLLGDRAYSARDYAQAAGHWHTALSIEGNEDRAQPWLLTRIAELYAEGKGVDKNPARAVDLLNKAAAKGFAPAKTQLGLSYQKGIGVVEDHRTAAQLFREAAEEGDSKAMAVLGVAYLGGDGVEKDEARGCDLVRKAAETGDAEAQSTLSLMYEIGGFGIEPDYAEALKWSQRAASSGHPELIDHLNALISRIEEKNRMHSHKRV